MEEICEGRSEQSSFYDPRRSMQYAEIENGDDLEALIGNENSKIRLTAIREGQDTPAGSSCCGGA